MEKAIDSLLGRLYDETVRLERAVMSEETDLEEWMIILDAREIIVKQIQELGLGKSDLTEQQWDEFANMSEINNRVISVIEKRKKSVQQQLNNIQRSKLAMSSYNEVGPNGYGAFFDRKK